MQRLGKARTPAGRERLRNSGLPSKHTSKEQVIFLSIAISVFFLVCVGCGGDEGLYGDGLRRVCEEYFLSLSPSSPCLLPLRLSLRVERACVDMTDYNIKKANSQWLRLCICISNSSMITGCWRLSHELVRVSTRAPMYAHVSSSRSRGLSKQMSVSTFRHLDVPLINVDEILTKVGEGESGEGGEGEGGIPKEAAMTAKKVQPPDLKKCAQQRELSWLSVHDLYTCVCACVFDRWLPAHRLARTGSDAGRWRT